jgi:hypothetical protein
MYSYNYWASITKFTELQWKLCMRKVCHSYHLHSGSILSTCCRWRGGRTCDSNWASPSGTEEWLVWTVGKFLRLIKFCAQGRRNLGYSQAISFSRKTIVAPSYRQSMGSSIITWEWAHMPWGLCIMHLLVVCIELYFFKIHILKPWPPQYCIWG